MWWRSIRLKSRSHDGFTLIEVLAALSIVATGLAAIGALFANAQRGARSIEARLHQLAIARLIVAALPDRDALVAGDLVGKTAGHAWRIRISPFGMATSSRSDALPWQPQSIVVTVQSSAGDAIQISTVRLQHKGGR
jgi:prepilin-type N-terminal cleavage/methylation domain-containing protein